MCLRIQIKGEVDVSANDKKSPILNYTCILVSGDMQNEGQSRTHSMFTKSRCNNLLEIVQATMYKISPTNPYRLHKERAHLTTTTDNGPLLKKHEKICCERMWKPTPKDEYIISKMLMRQWI